MFPTKNCSARMTIGNRRRSLKKEKKETAKTSHFGYGGSSCVWVTTRDSSVDRVVDTARDTRGSSTFRMASAFCLSLCIEELATLFPGYPRSATFPQSPFPGTERR